MSAVLKSDVREFRSDYMRFLKIIGLWMLLWALIGACFSMAGGHVHYLFQPFELLMIVGIYAVGFGGTSLLSGKFGSLRRLNKICFAVAVILPAFLGLLHAADYLDQERQKIASLVVAALMGVPHALVTFLAVEFALMSEQAESLARKAPSRFQTYRSRFLAGLGASTSVAFMGLIGFVTIDSYINPVPKMSAQYRAAREEYVNQAELDYVKKKCEPLTWEEKQNLYDWYDDNHRKPSSIESK
jgi:hypothetical protein